MDTLDTKPMPKAYGEAAARLASDLRLQRAFERLHRCGARAVATFMCELLDMNGVPARTLDWVLYWQNLDFAICRSVGGHRFPDPPLHSIPLEDEPPVAGGAP